MYIKNLVNNKTNVTVAENRVRADAQYEANYQLINDEVARLNAINASQDDTISANKDTADSKDVATNSRIDRINEVIALKDNESINRDQQLQSVIDANKQFTISQIDATNARISTESLYWDTINVGQNEIINENKAIADAQNIATNNRIDQTNSVVEQNNVDSIARDTQLQSNIDATNTKLTSEVARLDEVNATQDEAIAATNVRIDNIDTTITQTNTLMNNRMDDEGSR